MKLEEYECVKTKRRAQARIHEQTKDLTPGRLVAHPISAGAYLAQGVVTPKYADDARHVAACTVARHDYLVSWNFRHLVNVHRSAGFNAVNLLQGWPPVRIVNRLELIYGNQDQDV